MRILITRPQPSAADTATRLAAQGYDCLIAPVLVARGLPAQPVDIAGRRLIVTSPQAAHALAGWPGLHPMSALAVGTQTAALLRAGGFADIASADGDAAAILAHVGTAPQNFILACAPTTGQWLEDQLILAGHTVRRLHVYEIDPVAALPDAAVQALQDGSLTHVLFYSAFTAATFVRLAQAANRMANLARLTACCLSPAVAAAAGPGWQQVLTAVAPHSAALQALLPRIG